MNISSLRDETSRGAANRKNRRPDPGRQIVPSRRLLPCFSDANDPRDPWKFCKRE
jgi:hypothetical protein